MVACECSKVETSNGPKRSKLWGSDTANDASRVAGSDRESGDIFGNDGAGADDDTVTQGDTLKNYGTRSKDVERRGKIDRYEDQGLLALTVESKERPFARLSLWSPANRDKLYAR